MHKYTTVSGAVCAIAHTPIFGRSLQSQVVVVFFFPLIERIQLTSSDFSFYLHTSNRTAPTKHLQLRITSPAPWPRIAAVCFSWGNTKEPWWLGKWQLYLKRRGFWEGWAGSWGGGVWDRLVKEQQCIAALTWVITGTCIPCLDVLHQQQTDDRYNVSFLIDVGKHAHNLWQFIIGSD